LQRFERWQPSRSKKFKFDWPSIRSLATKGDRELKIAAVASAAFLGFAFISPVSCYVDWKDTHRKLDYIRYDANLPDPLVGLALSSYNLESYLNDTWNRYSTDHKSVKWVAQEFRYFIERNDYNERKLSNEGGSDWTRPYLGIFGKAVDRAKEKLYSFAGSIAKLGSSRGAIRKSWTHSSHDNTHVETYPCGTSKNPQTCTRIVCDSTDHSFRLNKPALTAALQLTVTSWASFPEVENENVGLFARTTRNRTEKPDEIDPWKQSPLVDNYGLFLSHVIAGRDGKKETDTIPLVDRFDANYETRTPFCGPPTSYPKGWKEKESILFSLDDTIGNYEKARAALTNLMAVSKSIQSSIAEIEKGNGHAAMRDLADLAWVIHNQNSATRHYSYLVVKILLLGGWILIAVVLYSLLSALSNRYRHTSWVRRFYSKYD